MAEVLAAIAVDAPAARVFALVRDLGQRGRFLPDGWRVLWPLSPRLDGVGATIELEAGVGPGATMQVVQVQVVSEAAGDGPGQSQQVESPPTADNYITTWTVRPSEGGCTVYLHTDFSYGGFLGELFARRRLRKAYAQMLARLKALAEAGR